MNLNENLNFINELPTAICHNQFFLLYFINYFIYFTTYKLHEKKEKKTKRVNIQDHRLKHLVTTY